MIEVRSIIKSFNVARVHVFLGVYAGKCAEPILLAQLFPVLPLRHPRGTPLVVNQLVECFR
jgi:hypothetical protein